eukprot:13262937-Alexandrium_andersonii.AAC.1
MGGVGLPFASHGPESRHQREIVVHKGSSPASQEDDPTSGGSPQPCRCSRGRRAGTMRPTGAPAAPAAHRSA